MLNISSIILEVLIDHENEIIDGIKEAIEDAFDVDAVIAALQPSARDIENLILEVATDEFCY